MITKEYLQQELAKRIDGYKRGVETTTDNIISEMKSILVLVDALPDHEKKYNEALERASHIKDNNTVATPQEVAEHIFPELRESEDERIRTLLVALVQWAKTFNQSGLNTKTANKMLSYLERQKEPTPADGWDYADKRMSHPLYLEGFEAGRAVERELSKFDAEWSEEDEKMLWSAINGLNIHIYEKERAWLANKLKSLRPQPSWKPSDEHEQKYQFEKENSL